MSAGARRYQEIARQIRHTLRLEGYKVGDKLPSERQMAQHYGVSRAQLRDALIMLEIENIVAIQQGSGIYLRTVPYSSVAPINNNHEDIGAFELIQARQLLESSIAELAARQVTKSDITAMQTTLEQERQAIEAGSLDYDNDKLFHLQIAQSSQNSALENTMRTLWRQREQSSSWQKLHENIFDTSYRFQWLEDHQHILNALKQKSSAQAKQAMWRHLENVRTVLLKLSNPENPQFDANLFPSYPSKMEEPLTPLILE